MNTSSTPENDALRIAALRLAAEADADPRTCLRALTEGPQVVRYRAVRAAIVRAAATLSITLGAK